MTSSNISYDRAIAQYEETTAAVAVQDVMDGKQDIITLTRDVPVVVNNVINLGDITTPVNFSGGSIAEIDIIVSASNFSVSKHYTLSCYWNSTNNVWKIAIPSVDSGPFASNDFTLDIRGNTYTTNLRLRRTSGTTVGTASIYLRLYGVGAVAWTNSSTTSSVTAPTVYYSNASVSQVADKLVFGGDTTLYRSNISTLATDGAFQAARIGVNTAPAGAGAMLMFMSQPNNYSGVYVDNTLLAGNNVWGSFHGTSYAGGQVLTSNVHGDAFSTRFRMDVAGRMIWGGGAVVEDTALYRNSVGELKTDAVFTVGTYLNVGNNLALAATNSAIYWGPALDVNLYRPGADALKTDDTLQALRLGVGIGPAAAGTAQVNITAATNIYGIYNSNTTAGGNSAPLYSAIAATAGSSTYNSSVSGDAASRWLMTAGGYMSWSDGTTAADTDLYRSTIGTLKTDGALNVNGILTTSYTRVLPVVVGNAIDILNFTASAGALDISITSASSGNVHGKVYHVPFIYHGTANFWYTVIPTSDYGPYSGNDFALDMNSNLGTHYIRLRRTVGTTPETVKIDIVFHTLDGANYTPTTATTTGATVVADWQSAFVTQTNGKLTFGSALDTNLYRSAANTLRTDDNFSTPNLIVNSSAFDGSTMAGPSNLDWRSTGDVYVSSASTGNITLRNLTSNAALQMLSNGVLQFVSGGTADTNLYRSGANNLRTDDTFTAGANLATDNDLVVTRDLYLNGTNTSKVYFGSAIDTNLYRSAADTLKTDDTFVAPAVKASGMVESNSDGWSGFAFLKADGTSYKGQIVAEPTTGMQIDYNSLNLGTPLAFRSNFVETACLDSAGKLTFGSARDTNLYRSAADILKTDDSFLSTGAYIDATRFIARVGGGGTYGFYHSSDGNGWTLWSNVVGEANARFAMTALGTMNWGAGGATATDTNLYRSAADTLKTDDTLLVAGTGGVQVTAGMVVASNNTGQMYFGSALDTNLYRSAANTLKTDDTFNAVGGVQVNGTSVLDRSTHTSTQSADTLTDGTINKAFLATERTKLTGIATGATVNSTDATLLARANHTGTQANSTVLNVMQTPNVTGKRAHWSTATINSDASSYATVTHGAGFTPTVVIATWAGNGLGGGGGPVTGTDTYGATTFRIRMALPNTNGLVIAYLCLE